MAEDNKADSTAASKEETKETKENKAESEKDKKDKSETEESKKSNDSDKPKEKEKEKKEILDEIDDGDLILEDQRISLPLNSRNALFRRSQGGLISMTLIHEDKDEGDEKREEYFERVIVLRSFPISNPDEFISVREPDNKKRGRGKELGMIRRLSDFDEASAVLINEELSRRYFSPVIEKIYSVKEKFGYYYWESDTSAGKITFILNNPFSNIRVLEDGRIYINDIDGNSFEIPDPKKLDISSYRKIEIYL